LANDLIGIGPQLQILTTDKAFNADIQTKFSAWAQKVCLAKKLRVMRISKCIDGEAFALLASNKNLRTAVQLDLKLYEAEQIASPYTVYGNKVDGIEFDEYGNPAFYYILKNHPGGQMVLNFGSTDKFAAEHVLHWYRIDRPGQSRGACEIASSLPLFSQLRRYTLAVLAAAETAADFAAVMETNSPADGESDPVTPLESIPLESRMMTVLPEGGRLNQIKAEQPTTTYADFKRQILGEISRVQCVPLNVILGDSSDYNYASGRLDYQMYRKSITIEQSDLEETVLDRIFERWLNEAILISGYLPLRARNAAELNWKWMWDGNEHVDPMKEAKAQDIHIMNGTSSYAREYSKTGSDWQVELDQVALEKNYLAEKLTPAAKEMMKIPTRLEPAQSAENGDPE
jgi:lambda family phage portal protein